MLLFLLGIALAMAISFAAVPDAFEFRDLGLNSASFVFAGTAFFAIWGNLALFMQGRKVMKAEKAEAISIKFFLVMLLMFSSQGLYGAERHSFALTFTSVGRMIFHIPILIGLLRFKTWRLNEKMLGIATAAYALANCLEIGIDKEKFFLIVSIAAIAATTAQPIEILRARKIGQVYIGLFVVYLINVSFWMAYAWRNDKLVFWTSTAFFAVYAITVALIVKCQRKGKEGLK